MIKKSTKKFKSDKKETNTSIEKLLNQQTTAILDAVDERLVRTESQIDEKFKKLPKIFATKDDLKKFATKGELDKTSTLLVKEIFATKDELSKRLDDIDEKFSNLQVAIDSYAKKSDSYFQEMVMLSHKVNRQEKWIQEIANKVGVQLEY